MDTHACYVEGVLRFLYHECELLLLLIAAVSDRQLQPVARYVVLSLFVVFGSGVPGGFIYAPCDL